jgi:intracellular multiplication protein IcmX
MTKIDYDQLYDNQKTSASAKKDLMTYLLKLRVYAAQNSVPISNLAYMMEKRMPQTPKTSDVTTTSTTSEAFNEYVMATWRLFSPGAKEQWISQIDKASSATVQKEIAILLAEISYQMYLTRRDQERLLLTNSMFLLQTMASNKPNTNVNFTSETDTTTN